MRGLVYTTFQSQRAMRVFQPASSHAVNLFLISLPYCNRLVESAFTDKCPHILVAHPRLSNNRHI